MQHPDLREQVIELLSAVLRDAEHQDEVVCTGAMGSLVELKAVETLPLIRRAFELGQIDEMMYGPWGSVLDEFGIEPDADDPLIAESQQRFDDRHERMFPRAQREELQAALSRYAGHDLYGTDEAAPVAAPPGAKKTANDQARKQKNKRKMSSAARKANRRKRK